MAGSSSGNTAASSKPRTSRSSFTRPGEAMDQGFQLALEVLGGSLRAWGSIDVMRREGQPVRVAIRSAHVVSRAPRRTPPPRVGAHWPRATRAGGIPASNPSERPPVARTRSHRAIQGACNRWRGLLALGLRLEGSLEGRLAGRSHTAARSQAADLSATQQDGFRWQREPGNRHRAVSSGDHGIHPCPRASRGSPEKLSAGSWPSSRGIFRRERQASAPRRARRPARARELDLVDRGRRRRSFARTADRRVRREAVRHRRHAGKRHRWTSPPRSSGSRRRYRGPGLDALLAALRYRIARGTRDGARRPSFTPCSMRPSRRRTPRWTPATRPDCAWT
jgi:hypothetical protein